MASRPEQSDADFGAWMKNVWQVVAGIPRGHVLTYGDVARLAGRKGWARRVGRALHRAPQRMKLPWHRVINAQGKISFPADSSAYREQRHLLEREGVKFQGERTRPLRLRGRAGPNSMGSFGPGVIESKAIEGSRFTRRRKPPCKKANETLQISPNALAWWRRWSSMKVEMK